MELIEKRNFVPRHAKPAWKSLVRDRKIWSRNFQYAAGCVTAFAGLHSSVQE